MRMGRPVALERIENDESHQLIEEFMLAANEAVARELKNRRHPYDLSRSRKSRSGKIGRISRVCAQL